MIKQGPPTVIYDGICNLCDKSVKFILAHEKGDRLRFTHLTSDKGQYIKREFGIDAEFDGILFLEDGILFEKSDAILQISSYLKAPYSATKHFFWIPRVIRDDIYDLIARNRYGWFGKDECIIPDEKLRQRFV